ncbi:YhgE/Pip domain-containing protein [uncultured Eubacterium sp.]|uniref:YhgE/Pip domain-containing protein n=1 Tax=uncultured Eubacterium sp. TaxID=165185 RepID=UPI0025F81F95|nr:YhgE/Pip domain-containing protein [uncultured Eubacterium sp.]
MNNILKIFKRDLKRLLRNRAAVLVIGGVCLLPSLYAWFNIDANMDPYGNTQGIKIAVANCDEGASTAQMTLDAGETIIENLKENKQLGWTFVDENEAKEGVKSGEYYAAIVIPENFSDSLLSILSGDIKKPELDYYINEKKNAIAPKITDTGATTLQQQINDTFSSVASEAISEVISSSAGNLTVDVDQTNSELLQTIQEVRENLSGYQGVLTDFQDTVKQSDSLINDTVKTLDQVKDSVESVSDTLNTGADLLKESRLATGSFATQISNSLSDGESFINDAYINAAVKFGKLETQAEQITTSVSGSIDSVNELNQKNKQILDELSKLHDSIGGDSQISASIGEQITKLQQQNQEFSQLLDSLNSGNSAIADSMKNARTTRTDLEQIAGNSKNSLRDYKNSLCQDVLPKVDESLDAVASVSGNFSAILSGITPTADQLKAMLQQLQTSLDDSVNALTKTGEALEKVDVQLASTATDVQALQSSEAYQQILSLEGIDAEAISDFMSSPVSITSEVLYDVKNYGSGMTPFYTNLALWVGGLILVSILKQEVDKDEEVSDFSSTSAYFGRWMLFVALGLIQGFIVCLGDLILLKVQCVHPVAFVCTGVFCSFVYVNIIYALALTFKHIGKALGVFFIILQIPGSSGTYPIEMMPGFFQKLNPFLPFTYAIRAMRECIAGYYDHTYVKNLNVLWVFVMLALFIGLVLRPLLMNLNHLFDRRLEETEMMVGETATSEKQLPQAQLMLKTLMQNDATKKKFIEKSGQFEQRYPKMIKMGFAGIIVIPLVFLILSFSLQAKFVFLILWILSLIALVVYLICVEYVHDRIVRQLEMSGLSSEELVNMIKEGNDR